MKQCKKCNNVKPDNQYSSRKDTKDGLQYWCRECVSLYKSERQHTRKAYNSKYYQTKKYKSDAIKRQTERRESGCLKVTARDLLHKAIASGKIIKPSICSKCNKEFEDKRVIHGHHPDYNFPYFIEWLCRNCHNLFHKEQV